MKAILITALALCGCCNYPEDGRHHDMVIEEKGTVNDYDIRRRIDEYAAMVEKAGLKFDGYHVEHRPQSNQYKVKVYGKIKAAKEED